jgi:type II secretion system protein H
MSRTGKSDEEGRAVARHSSLSTRHCRSGFTLIELIVVLMGLVVMAAVVVPAMRGAGNRGDLDSAVTRVVASARFARQAAVERQETVALTVEAEPSVVRLMSQAEMEPTPAGNAVMQAPLPAAFAAVRLPARVTAHLEAAPEERAGTASVSGAVLADGMLRFTPDGRTTGGVVVLMDERGRERRVLVTPETGVVRIEDGDGE